MKSFTAFFLPALAFYLFSCSPSHTEIPGAKENEEAALHSFSPAKPVAAAAVPETADFKTGKRDAAEMVAAGFKRYGIEKGIFTFRLYGAVTGYEVLYFDHWGWREGRYIRTTADVGSYKEKTNKVQYLDGERRYEYDPESQIAHYFDSPQIQASADKYGTKDMTVVTDEMTRQMGGVPVGKELVKGVECEVWRLERMKTTLCLAYGITMREESFASGIPVSRVAISVKTDVEVPEEKMTLPDGAKQVDINAR